MPGKRCPRCNSPSPERHPALQHEGEVYICTEEFHLTPTPQNLPMYRDMVRKRRAEKGV